MVVANTDSVATPESAANIIQSGIDNYGQIDILINNAGNLRDKSFAKLQPEDFDAVLDVHLSGSAYCTLAVWLHMKDADYGRIVEGREWCSVVTFQRQKRYSPTSIGSQI